MLEDDPLKKSLIHGYGSRGIALARLDDLTDDEELNELARRVAFHEDDDEDPDTPDQPFTTIKVNLILEVLNSLPGSFFSDYCEVVIKIFTGQFSGSHWSELFW